MQTEAIRRKDIFLAIEILLGVILLIIVSVFLLMRPKPAPVVTTVVEPTSVLLPTITPLPTTTPFPTPTPIPTSTPEPTLPPTPTPTPIIESESESESEPESDLPTSDVVSTGEVTYTVKAGDTLSDIAEQFGVSSESIQIVNDMEDETVYLDQVLTIPESDSAVALTVPGFAPGTEEYTVRAGDTLGIIAERLGVDVEAIIEANDLDSDVIQLGQKLIIPTGD